MTRRRWLQGMFALTAASLTGSLALKAFADDASATPIDAFITFSQSLTAKNNLDRDVGLRLLAALQKSVPDLQQQLLLCNGKVGQLAKRVGMERTHLYRKLRALGVDFRQLGED